MKYIDIHCHLDSPDYSTELVEVLVRMKEAGVGAITIGTDLESSKRAVKIAEENENIWACIGVHPVEFPSPDQGLPAMPARQAGEGRVGFPESEFEKLVAHSKVVGIGECGLDYFAHRSLGEGGLSEEEKTRQINLFKQQIEFAMKHDKPLMLHCRNARQTEQTQSFGRAYNEVLEILESYKKAEGPEAGRLRGNCHFFAGNMEQAKRFVDLGFTCSFTGVITFSRDYDEVIKSLPLESILSETDSPFVAPVPYRGERNEPVYALEVVNKLALIKEIDPDLMKKTLVLNAIKLFGLVV